MSLRYIPDSTKVSPFEMVIRSLEKFNKDQYKEEKKRKESIANIMLMKRLFNLIGLPGSFIGGYLDTFSIEEEKPKKVIDNLFTSLYDDFFSNGKFQKERFDEEMKNLYNIVSARYSEINSEDIFDTLVNNNEVDMDSFENKILSTDLESFRAEQGKRLDELKLLSMMLISADGKDLAKMKAKFNKSQIVSRLTDNKEFANMRAIYQESIKVEKNIKETLKQEKKHSEEVFHKVKIQTKIKNQSYKTP